MQEIRAARWALLVMVVAVAPGCEGPKPVRQFGEVAGCYRAQGLAVLSILPNGAVLDPEGRRLGTAALDVRGRDPQTQAALVKFTPGLAIASDRRRAELSGEAANEHLIMAWRGEVALSLRPRNFQPGETLIRGSLPCT